MNCEMFWEIGFPSIRFAALVALEKLLPTVPPCVAVKSICCSASVFALVTLEWFFSSELCHHVNF